ncbi:MAG TPA: hypothetical protein VL500_00610 [Candidatus Eisenbacteria bacterium]|nr:hypothetical protein [Candidatus Eisenbacteria bacterium]
MNNELKNTAMKKTIMIAAVAALVAGGASFYGGMTYAKTKSLSARGGAQDFRNLSPEERQARFGAAGGPGGRQGNRMMGGAGGFVGGEVLSKDDTSVTIKMRDGSTKIVLFADSTEITKQVEGAKADLEVGKNVMVTGKANPDGSVTAQTISLRPEGQFFMMTPPPGGPAGGDQKAPPPQP